VKGCPASVTATLKKSTVTYTNVHMHVTNLSTRSPNALFLPTYLPTWM
jgi:hypothetical protein